MRRVLTNLVTSGTLLAVGLCLVGCLGQKGVKIDIQTPVSGSTVSALDFKVILSGSVVPASVKVVVNSSPLAASSFQVQPSASAATLSGKMDPRVLQQGNFNTLVVEASDTAGKKTSAQVSFIFAHAPPAASGSQTVPTTPTASSPGTLAVSASGPAASSRPTVVISSPKRGTFLPLGQEARIEGTATDDGRVARLRIEIDARPSEDVSAALDPISGAFSIPLKFDVPGIHRVRLVATDTSGNQGSSKVSFFVGAPMKRGTMIRGASSVTLDARGIYHLGKLIQSILTPSVIFAKIPKIVWRASDGGIRSDIELEKAGHAGLVLDLRPGGAGWVNASVTVEGVYLQLMAHIKSFVARYHQRGFARLDRVSFGGRLHISKKEKQGVAVSITNVTFEATGFQFKIKHLSGLTGKASRYFDSFIQTEVKSALVETIPKELEKKLNEYFFVTEPQRVEVDGHIHEVTGELTDLDVEGQTASFKSSSRTVAVEQTPPPGGLEHFVSTPNEEKVRGKTLNDVTAYISDDFMNQRYYEAWRAGSYDFDFDFTKEASGTHKGIDLAALQKMLGIDIPGLRNLSLNLPVQIKVRLGLPPTIAFGHEEKMIKVHVHEALVVVYLKLSKEHRQELFSIVVDANVPLERIDIDQPNDKETFHVKDAELAVQLSEDKEIKLQIASLPGITLSYEKLYPFTELTTRMVMPFLLQILKEESAKSVGKFTLIESQSSAIPNYLIVSGRIDYPKTSNAGPPIEVGGSSDKGKVTHICGLTRVLGDSGGARVILDAFRRFRDDFLYPTAAGTALAHLYYTLSIPASEFLRDQPVAALLVALPAILLGIVLLLAPELLLVGLALVAVRKWRSSFGGSRSAIFELWLRTEVSIHDPLRSERVALG